MKKIAVPVLCMCLLSAPAWSQSMDASSQEGPVAGAASDAAPEQIHVVAQRPGPGMWKVSKGEHVLWVFGTYGPLPKQLQWRSRQVETVIKNSQEYLEPPGSLVRPGFLRSITLLPQMIGVRKNPDGAQLRDVMSAEDYALWRLLKAKYLPDNDDVERERPIFAAQALTRSAHQQAGLAHDNVVRKQVLDLIKASKLKETSSIFEMPMDNARTVLKNFKKSTLGDAACLSQTMATLESDIAAASARADAWAKGDLDVMRGLDFATRKEACFGALMNSAALEAEPEFKNMKMRADAKWLASAERALEANTSTFAMLPMADILDAKGVMAALAARGYQVEQPQ